MPSSRLGNNPELGSPEPSSLPLLLSLESDLASSPVGCALKCLPAGTIGLLFLPISAWVWAVLTACLGDRNVPSFSPPAPPQGLLIGLSGKKQTSFYTTNELALAEALSSPGIPSSACRFQPQGLCSCCFPCLEGSFTSPSYYHSPCSLQCLLLRLHCA